MCMTVYGSYWDCKWPTIIFCCAKMKTSYNSRKKAFQRNPSFEDLRSAAETLS